MNSAKLDCLNETTPGDLVNLNPERQFLLDHIDFAKTIVEAYGHYLKDTSRNEYLDFLSQYGAIPFGHNPDFLWDVVINHHKDRKPVFCQPLYNQEAIHLSQKLIDFCGHEMKYVTYTNSGAEAVEAALKLVRNRSQKKKVISTTTGFHGKTFAALSATGNEDLKRQSYTDENNHVHLEFNNVDELRAELTKGDACAVIIEIVQGEGGMHVISQGYLSEASKLCKQHGAYLIVDEIQTGIGRLGARLGLDLYDHVDVDIILLAKALGGGVIPIGAMLANKRVWSESFGLNHSSTFANNSLACSVGYAVLNHIMENEQALFAHVTKMGQIIKNNLDSLIKRYPGVYEEARGQGLMWGLQLQAWSGEYGYFTSYLSQQGFSVPIICGYLLNRFNIITAPTFGSRNVLRVQPSLTISEEEIARFFNALENVTRLLFEQKYNVLFEYVVNK